MRGDRLLDFGFYNMDCMEGMKQFPDKYFDLAIVDPPYGINIGDEVGGGGAGCSRSAESETPNSNRRRNAVWKQVTVGGSLQAAQNLQGIR